MDKGRCYSFSEVVIYQDGTEIEQLRTLACNMLQDIDI